MAGALAFTSSTALAQQTEIPVDTLVPDTSKHLIQVDTNKAYYKMTGTVKDTNGNPLGGALIDIHQGDSSIARSYSLSTGNFAFFINRQKITSDTLMVMVSRDTFLTISETVHITDSLEWNHDFVLTNISSWVVAFQEPPWQIIASGGVTPYQFLGFITSPLIDPGTIWEMPPIDEPEPEKDTVAKEIKLEGDVWFTDLEKEHRINTRDKNETNRPDNNKNKNTGTEINAVLTDDNELKIYPNPASDFIFIEFLFPGLYRVDILNETGEIVLMIEFSGNKIKTDISQLAPGKYIVTAVDSDREETHRQNLTIAR